MHILLKMLKMWKIWFLWQKMNNQI